LDKAVGSLSLVIANQFRTSIWAEEVAVAVVSDAETKRERYKTTQTILKICKQVSPFETLPISLMNTIYNVAGRPHGFYSCAIFAVLRYRMNRHDKPELEQPLPPYHARITGLVPISLKRIGWLDKRVQPSPENMLRHEPGDSTKCERRSERITAKSAIVVKGRFNDGTEFSDVTHTLVLSAHGCLVTMAKPVSIGENVIVQNTNTLQVQRCHVVYVRHTEGGEIRVGLAFEMEAPDFWGIDGLPTMAVGESPATS
jgi:hypothetical protein